MTLEFRVDLINEYLKDNGKEPNTGFLTRDNGQGNFIAKWEHEDLPQPSLQKLQPYVNIIAERTAAKLKERNIKKEIPTLFDQVEALVEQYKADRDNGKILEGKLNAIIDDIEAVKAKYSD